MVQAKCVGICWPGIVLLGKKWGEIQASEDVLEEKLTGLAVSLSKRETQGIPRLCKLDNWHGQILHDATFETQTRAGSEARLNGVRERTPASRTIFENFLCLDSRIQI